MRSITLFAPATVANVSCGFDLLGFALESVGDQMLIRENKVNQLRITKIEGQTLPMQTEKNVAGVAGLALLNQLNTKQGFDIEIYKKIKPGSGIGSSAASAAGAVFGLNELLGKPFSSIDLVAFAMKGEALAGGAEHGDNVAPCLLGGFTLIQSYNPLRVVSLPTPEALSVVILHPQIEVKTADARNLLKQQVSLKKAVRQSGYLGGFVAGLFQNDYDLLAASLRDEWVESSRSVLIPAFDEMKVAALASGALGFGISGSGPSVFALCKGVEIAKKTAEAIRLVFDETAIPYDLHHSEVNPHGVKIL
ncbi:MAG: homoserine kinase [Flavobacteriaceae bacterium]|nr:homoserine kinase [Flavobacteriaceae bacterium]